MDIITSVQEMQAWADAARQRGQRIGCVPTMGYLHDGHLSLVHLARQHSDVTVVSIFVNPLQFGANEDLSRYPRDLDRDTQLVRDAHADALFLPAAAEMYPQGFQTAVHVERVTQGFCAADRPTHFQGVTTVVTKLFSMMKPHCAVFGSKDYQQLAAIQRMVWDLNFDIEIIGAPIVREADGLAMSSRNAYLSAAQREAARCVPAATQAARACVEAGEQDSTRILDAARQVIAAQPLAQLSYADLADIDTLERVQTVDRPVQLLLAVHIGQTRLIDNCRLVPQTSVAAANTTVHASERG